MQRLVRALSSGQFIGVYATLPRRALLHLHGPDTYRFLNGLVTQKIERFDAVQENEVTEKKEKNKNSGSIREVVAEAKCLYGAFLTSKGRILTDAFFYHRPVSRSWFVEVDRTHIPTLVRHLEQYKLRSKVYIEEDAATSWHVAALLCASTSYRDELLRFLLNAPLSSHDLQFYPDPRHPLFLRFLIAKGSIPSCGSHILYSTFFSFPPSKCPFISFDGFLIRT
jgi:hypothetical protein